MKILATNFVSRFYTQKTDTQQVVIMGSLFSMGMMCFRMVYTGSFLFVFLVWNLFLAFIPYALSSWMEKHMLHKSKGVFLMGILAWLLFIPNAFYILTDLFHLDMNEAVPLWYDLALLLSFAWNGLLFGIVSVRQMEKLFEKHFGKKFDLLFIFPVMLLNGFGVYLGRFLRFNSWDFITNPFELVKDIVWLFLHPLRNRFDWSMIFCYTLLLTVIYTTIKRLSRVLSEPAVTR